MAKDQVVTLTSENWQLYKQIRLESLLMEPHAFSSNYSDVLQRPDSHWQERLIEAQAGEKSCLLFAKENEQIIGMIGATFAEENGVVEIISVYVSKEKRGHGVATALMASILEEVGQGNAFWKAVLTVSADQTAAVAIYGILVFKSLEIRAESWVMEISTRAISWKRNWGNCYKESATCLT